jgi:2-keto-4-pentenoate hydratase/2-oxohepta-3-ene-1,7-dioic acid hydratase in catechol pathway
MKICTYTHKTPVGNISRMGIMLSDNTILDPNFCWQKKFEIEGHYNAEIMSRRTLPSTTHELLESVSSPIDQLTETLEIFNNLKKLGADLQTKNGASLCLKLDEPSISLSAPLQKISTYRDFYTFEKHVKTGFKKRNEEVPPAWYEIPAYYKGATAGFIGDGETIPWPSYTEVLDYELELAMVVGKSGKNISKKNAVKHMFGLTILNDISARDIQKKEMSIRLGPAKGKDFCSIIGPVITTMDEFNYIEPDLLMQAFINGDEWSKGNSSEAQFNFADMLQHASKDEWVLPGDLFGSGTVGTGCGLELDKWIKPSDEIKLTIESIGSLTNTVGSPT